MQLAYEKHFYNSTKAKQDLGFNPRPLDDTINDTIKWFTNEYFPNKKS
jgi:nucleoside-diphosphate-sugar epimerase